MNMDGPESIIRELSSLTPKSNPASLVHMSLVSYLKFLEDECATYVMLSTLNSALWNPVRRRLFGSLKHHLKRTFKEDTHQSGLIRTVLVNQALSGRYPGGRNRNAYNCTTSRFRPNAEDTEDFDLVTKTLDSVKNHGRKCSSVCCTGAFIAETMLAVLVNEDVSHLVFDANLCDRFYRNKPIRPLMFFDITSVLVHYLTSLDDLEERSYGLQTPSLTKLVINSPNLGPLTSQSVYGRLFQVYKETKHFHEYPWKLSNGQARPTSQFMMLTLSNLFDRPPNFFTNLTYIKLSGECINTRLKVIGDRGGHAVTHLFAGLAHSCPVLETLDFSEVTSLCPESLLYLCYQDAYLVLHKYMYLPPYNSEDNLSSHEVQGRKHDGVSYCHWCKDPALKQKVRNEIHSNVYILDDRLYEYIEKNIEEPGCMLLQCVKVSQLIKAFTDPVHELKRDMNAISIEDKPKKVVYHRKYVDEVETKSPLCYTMKELRLPGDDTDSKAWVLPLLLTAMPNLITLGEPYIYDALKLMHDLQDVRPPRRPLNLEEAILKLDENSLVRVMAKQFMRLISLTSWYTKWSRFIETMSSDEPCLEHWVLTDLKKDLDSSSSNLLQVWRDQIQTMAQSCPHLKLLKINIKSNVLNFEYDLWQPLATLKYLKILWIHSSSRNDIVSLLKVIGKNLAEVNLRFSNQRVPLGDEMDLSSIGLINIVPHFCPNLSKVCYGHWQGTSGSIPHSLCDEERYFDSKLKGYQNLTHFEAAGNILQTAFFFLWERAEKLKSIRISGDIVNANANLEETMPETIFTLSCIETYFRLNPMKDLKTFDVPMTFNSLCTVNQFLELLPEDMDYIATLNIVMNMNDLVENEAVEDAISAVFTRMVNFKLSCKRREVDKNCTIKWKWKPEGLLTILLNQQMMSSMAEFVQP